MRRARSMPSAVHPSQKPTALAAIRPIRPQGTAPPLAVTSDMPTTTARMMIPQHVVDHVPRARMVTPSGESSLLFSLRMRAVMPTRGGRGNRPQEKGRR